ncbi:dermonecrotic toxin domain-containing protein [Pseudomonas sp.]|uniref:dermonecrotic toxin domain-containing protein n=1 Tax=Pseudomonas sp. TaxID=306 RepID=UPI003BB687FD
MQANEHPQSAATTATRNPRPDVHYLHLQASLPQWLGNASATRRQAMKATQPQLPLKLQALPAGQHQLLKTLNAAHWTAQSDVDRQLEHFKDASSFAEPLLKAALKSRFDLELDVRTTFLRLYLPATTPLFSIKTGARTWTVSLLDAALHNFEQKETEDDAYEASSTFITQPSPGGQFDTLPQIKEKLSITAFTRLCRALDIGAQYMTYLQAQLGFTQPATAADLRQKIDKSQQAALKAALQFARMNRDISEGYFRTITALAEGTPHLRIDGQPLQCHSLTMMSAPLTDIIVFAPPAYEPRTASRVVAYVPDDPLHPIKEYASSAELEVELTRQLRASDYQTFFSRFINHDQRGFFFASLNSRLSRVTWHAPVTGSQQPPWRDEPFARPDLQMAATPIRLELWEHLYQGKLNKILNDARTLAVATASVDSKVRWALWDSLVGIASSIVQTAAFIIAPFVPVLGEMMMAYMAYQFVDEVFEGIIDWTMGQTAEAIQHLIGTVDSLIQLGGFAVGGAIVVGEFRKVLPKEIVAFIDRFNPVRMPDGQTRYWQPDLQRYEHSSAPDARSRPNPLGLHQHQGKQLLPLDDAHFAVSESPVPGQYRIDHPSRADAYRPRVRHNGDGAWHAEFEQPLAWDKATALRRIGHAVESLTPAQRERVLHISGYDDNALRLMHADQQPLPPLLADSIARFKIDQDLQLFIEQLGSDSPAAYCAADPLTQLQLLSEHDRWPAQKRLRLIDAQGEVTWQSSSNETLAVTDIHQGNLVEDDVLKTLLLTLAEPDAKVLLGEAFADTNLSLDTRVRNLRQQLLQHAKAQRGTLFESRYQAIATDHDPLVAQLARHEPSLPPRVTQALLDNASGDELLLISEGQLPARQQTLIQHARDEVRVTRAFEGLELDSVNNPDTDTLALHSLAALPGWTGEVRLEIRDEHYEGAVLASSGHADAPAQKVLVRRTDGRYQPFDERGQELHSATDFYSSVLYALPDSERQALNLQIGQTQQLQAAIRGRPLAREELRVAISLPSSAEQQVTDLVPLGRASLPAIELPVNDSPYFDHPAPVENIRAIYRDYTAEQAEEFASSLHNDRQAISNELARLMSELTRLRDDLRSWESRIPTKDPGTGLPLTDIEIRAQKYSRATLRNDLERCWRRQTSSSAGYILQIRYPLIGDLPVLNADFSHVASLLLNGSSRTGNINGFLQPFARLQYLDMQHLNLTHVPPAISAMPTLRQLTLRDCGIVLPAANRAMFAPLSELQLLDLQGNPLGVAPDVQAMPALRYVNLSNTDIATLPHGLLDHPRLITGRFAHNQLTDIPEAFFELAPVLSDGFNFADNPLSPTGRERVKRHYQRTQKHFGVLPEEADSRRVAELFPALDAERITELLYQLPGTLADGRAQLATWETELSGLQQDLSRWGADIPEHEPGSLVPLTFNEKVSERLARQAFSNKVEQLWRQSPPSLPALRTIRLDATAAFIGDLPALRADFSHVREIILNGNKEVSALQPFLNQFQQLTLLELNFFDLAPATLSSLDTSQLLTLRLRDCGVTMTPENQAALCAMPQLQILELRGNPLGSFFDLNLMPSLKYLDLSATGLRELPPGLTDAVRPRTALLSENNFVELPDALFDMQAEHGEGISLADNQSLSVNARNRIKSYFRRTGNDFSVLADPADIALAKELFPNLDTVDASELIYDLPGTLADSRAQLQAWKVELATLKEQLIRWATRVPERDPLSGDTVDAVEMYNQYLHRAEFSQRIQGFWQNRSSTSRLRNDEFVANLNFTGELPQLTADFSHVATLRLKGNAEITGISAFIELFPNALVVEMHDFALSEVPSLFAPMTQLKELTLSNCGITLTPEGQDLLHSLTDLERLDLSNNPLVLVPDLTAMPGLNDLRLSNTGITSLPEGLVTHPNLRGARLTHNAITDLPEVFFSMDVDLADGIDLADNPLSPATRDRIKTYYVATGYDIGILPDPADITRAQSLFPQLSLEDASHVIYQLPGTLADGSTQLVRWEIEIAQMISDLSAWSERAPKGIAGQNMDAVDRVTQRARRKAFSKTLERLWRSRQAAKAELRANFFNLNLNVAGDLPTLSVDFSHISRLALEGNERLTSVEGFLNCFSGLEALEMRRFSLGRLPRSVARMSRLRTLAMTSCGIVFDESAQATLSALSHLRGLDMYNNPLGSVPQIAALKALDFIDLSRTEIDRLPAGLHELPYLKVALFSENLISELPEEIFHLPDRVKSGFDLDNNPLTPQTRERIKAHHHESGIDFGVSISPEDNELARLLYPLSSDVNINDIVYSLPGTLADGRVELVRRQTELTTLVSDLDAWAKQASVNTPGSAALDAESLHLQQTCRDQFKTRLEYCWRRVTIVGQSGLEFAADLPIMGELPTLSADFSHVQKLTLTSTSDTAPRVGRFLEGFPNLQELVIQGYGLGDIPEAVLAMDTLKILRLPLCQISLTPSTVEALAKMKNLNTLVLRNNLLSRAPDVGRMPELSWLDLSHTGIDELPTGLFNGHDLATVDLSGNAIVEVPIELLNSATTEFDFSDNPLSEISKQRVNTQRLARANALTEQQGMQEGSATSSASTVNEQSSTLSETSEVAV